MVKKQDDPKKKQSKTSRRSKLKKERELRLKAKQKINMKRKANEELLRLVKPEVVDQLDTAGKIKTLNNLFTLVTSFPDKNYDKIQLIFVFLKDNSLKVVMRSIKSLVKIFIDLLPSYQIKNDEEEGSSAKLLSKEVESLHKFEQSLLSHYEEFIRSLNIFEKTFSNKKKQSGPIRIFHTFIIKTICQLFDKFYYFNYSQSLYKILIEKLADEGDEVRTISFNSLFSFLSMQDNSSYVLQLKLAIIKLLSHSIFIKSHEKFDENVMDLFIAHKIEFPDISQEQKKFNLTDLKVGGKGDLVGNKGKMGTNVQRRLQKREQKQLDSEKNKIIKSMKKEMMEIEGTQSHKVIYYMNLKILKKILLVFLDILKHKKDSKLLRGVFHGIGILSENINIEILIDLQKCIYELIEYKLSQSNVTVTHILFCLTALKSNLNITEKLTKEIISIEDTHLINSTYHLLCLISSDESLIPDKKEDLFILLEILENILIKKRQFSMDVVSSYVKRLSMFILQIPGNQNFVAGLLLLLKRIFQKYSSLNSLLEEDLANMNQFNYMQLTDPSLCNGKLSSISQELQSVRVKYSKIKLIKQLCDYIEKCEKTNENLSSLNYYDLILQ